MDFSTNKYLIKIVLKVTLEENSSVKIQLDYIHINFIKKTLSNDYMYYKNEEQDFVLWSSQDFIFDYRQIRLPDDSNLAPLMIHTHKFEHDIARYETLNKIYNTLNKWSHKMDFMQGCVETRYINKINLVDDYWTVY